MRRSTSILATKYKGFIKVLLATGMRITEFCGQTVDDIDYENKEISVNK
ncbi:tyrosine-type recombinase/integrase [Erysipelotrichaceae bacterium RD49]|nr:tyrosine-type recombinase/integrase [Erysipelotrichaceae bacterium RD49]